MSWYSFFFLEYTYIDLKVLLRLEKRTWKPVLRREIMKFYTIKLPRFLGGIVRAMLGSFKKG